MKTIHFVYVKGTGIRTPAAITNELSKRLETDYRVEVHDWAAQYEIHPSPGDVLLGHPHPSPATVFRRSFYLPGWHKRLVMLPFRHAPYYSEIAWWDPLICQADRFIAICAPYWTDTMSRTWTSHWAYKTVQVDLAINKEHFPFLKNNFNPIGQRKFLFIGWVAKYKGFDYFLKIVKSNPKISFGWIGPGEHTVECDGLAKYGQRDFSLPENQDIVKTYDFMITCGRSDPNPTTILEASGWGLIPVCTPQSGYYKQDWIINIPLDNINDASAILNELNETSENTLRNYQQRGQAALAGHYTWDRLASQVKASIEEPTPCTPSDFQWRFRYCRNRIVLALYGAGAYLLPLWVSLRQMCHNYRVRWWKLQVAMRTLKNKGV